MDTINIGAYGFLQAIAGMAIEVKMVSMKFAVMFAVLTAIYGVVKFFFGFEDSQKINFKKYVWTPLITIFILANYSYLIDITDSIGSLIINSMPSAGDKSVLTELLNSASKRKEIENAKLAVDLANSLADEDKNIVQKGVAFVQNAFYQASSDLWNPLRFLGKLFQSGWVSLCRLIVENVRGVILGFLVIAGPLALLFSITPIHREMMNKWYKMYVAVLLWAVTINILDALVISYAQTSVDVSTYLIYLNDKSPEAQAAAVAAAEIMSDYGGQAGFVNFTFGLMYLCVPLLTAFFIGDRMAGGLLSFVMMKSIDYGMKAISGAVSGGKSMIGSSSGGGGGGGGETSGTE